MAIIFEDSEKIINKQIPINKQQKDYFKAMDNLYKPYEDRAEGGHVLKSLASDKQYGKRGEKSKNNGETGKTDTISVDDAKIRLHRMQKFAPNSVQYQMYGGEAGEKLYKDGIRRARAVNTVSPVEPPKPITDADTKPAGVKTKEISKPNGKIKLAASRQINTDGRKRRINESDDDWHEYFDYLEEYDEFYVLGQFFENPQGKENWGVLINPDMYQKALAEFTKYGKLIKFPTKYVYQWMGIIMKNTAILRANTDLAGHSSSFPGDVVADYAERIDGIQIGDDYEEGREWLEKKGLYDWMEMPDGHYAVTDYGLDPLEKIIGEYNENLPPEKVLVLVNRILDVYHGQGPLCSMFIGGGKASLDKIAEEVKKGGKKIYISESALMKLSEIHAQLKLPFKNDSGMGYDLKESYEHFIDWLESRGKYGNLPNASMSYDDIERKIRSVGREALERYDQESSLNDSEDYVSIDTFNELFLYAMGMGQDSIDFYFCNIPKKVIKKASNYHTSLTEELAECGLISYYDVDQNELESFLTSDGYQKFQEFKIETIIKEAENNGVPEKLTFDDRGLIYVEREITIPSLHDTRSVDADNSDYYQYLDKNFNGVGNCWTWDKGCGEAYYGDSFNGDYAAIVLKGWVDPSSVDWATTVDRNAYGLNYENEIYIPRGMFVEIYEIVVTSEEDNGKRILTKPIVIRT